MQVEAWKQLPWLWHGFSTRHGGVSTVYRIANRPQGDAARETEGDLNLGWTKDDDTGNVQENRRRLVEAVTGASADSVPLITVRQVHAAHSLMVSGESIPAFSTNQGRPVREADGLMTEADGLLLGIQTADCVPVLVADTRQRVVAAFHAGWRGTAARIVEHGVAQMCMEYATSPEDLIAVVGPSIGACCYSVGDEVYEKFLDKFGYGETLFTRRTGEHHKAIASELLYLDLWEANRRQLIDSGIAAEQIEILGECTGCAGLPGPRRYFSHRRENGFTGRMLSVIGIAKHPSS